MSDETGEQAVPPANVPKAAPPMGGPEIFAAFIAAQGELQNPTKDQQATIQPREGRAYSYSYVDLADVIEGVRPVLAKHGLGFVQDVRTDNGRIAVTTMLLHTSGQMMSFGPMVGPGGSEWRAIASGISYAKRYALLAALGIAPANEDDDADAAGPELDELSPEQCAAYIARFGDAANMGDLNKARHELRKFRLTDEQAVQLEDAYTERAARAEVREPRPARATRGKSKAEEPKVDATPIGVDELTPLFDELDAIEDRAVLKAFHDRPDVVAILDRPYDDSGDTMRVRIISKIPTLPRA